MSDIRCPTAPEGILNIPILRGVPRGSVVNPLLWNVAYNEVLKLDMPLNTEVIGFVDDTLVVASGNSIYEVGHLTNRALLIVVGKISEFGLYIAVHKTEAIRFTSRKNYDLLKLEVIGLPITTGKYLKYLGIIMDKDLLYKEHIRFATNKGKRVLRALFRIMPNIGGSKQTRCRILVSVIHSVMLYSVPS